MNIDNFKKMIDKINSDGWDEYSEFFNNDIGIFAKLLVKTDLVDYFDFKDLDDINEFLKVLFDLDSKKTTELSLEFLSDVTVRDGKYYLFLRNLSDLSVLFNRQSRDQIESILDDVDYEPFYDTTYNIYSDVIEELNKDNLAKLKNIIFNELNDKTIYPGTKLLTDMSDGDDIIVNSDNFEVMFNDEKTLVYLLTEYVEDVISDLYSLHNGAYNQTYITNCYETIWYELSTFFVGKPIQVKNGFELEINNFPNILNDYLHGNIDEIDYLGSFENILVESIYHGIFEELRFYSPEYPDYYDVRRYINDYFSDYL